MRYGATLTTKEILAAFADGIGACGGRVTDTFDDGERLFTRSVLPSVKHVRTGDQVQGGVALKATDAEAWVHPYLFRLVCQNGAIMAQTIESRHLAELQLREPDEALRSIREAVESCCAEEVFANSAQQMRSASSEPVDLAINLLPMLSRLPRHASAELFSAIIDRFFHEKDRTRFGLANAVTALARDTRDPELRWDLEELGGAIAAHKTPGPPDKKPVARVQRRGVLVG